MKNKAFTLIEVLVTIFVLTLVMIAVTALVLMVYKTHGYTWQQSVAIDEARRGVEVMVKEIREAKPGDDGSYPIESAEDKEFIFYSDVDKDGATERVRYFLGGITNGNEVQECVTFNDGGSCSVVFSSFFTGTLIAAQVEISVEGDFSWNNREYAEITADGVDLGDVCRTGCLDCPGSWDGVSIYDVIAQASDNSIQFIADSTWRVNDICDWQDPNHAMKVRFELSWTAESAGLDQEFRKGIVNPVGFPVEYPIDQEVISVLSNYVQNAPPIFKYYNAQGEEIEETPARLGDTKVMRVLLIVDVDTNRAPEPFELESSVQLRNLKEE